MGELAAIAERVLASKALVGAFKGAPGFVHVSAAEREALEEILASVELAAKDVTKLIIDIQAVGLERDDEVVVLRMLQGKLSGKPKKAPVAPAVAPERAAATDVAPADAARAAEAPEHAPRERSWGVMPSGQGKMQNFENIQNYWPTEASTYLLFLFLLPN